MPRIKYHLCANVRCRRPINAAGRDVTPLGTEEAILTASVRTADGYRCPDCVRSTVSLSTAHPKVALSPCGDLYPTAVSIGQMVETPAWLEDYIQETADETPTVWMATNCNGYSRKISGRKKTADSRQMLSAAQQEALRCLLSGDTSKVDKLMSFAD